MKSLLGYHLGTLSHDERIAVEERLLSSPTYLCEFFALKSSFEDLPEQKLVPSAKLKSGLRADLAQTLYRKNNTTAFRGFLTPGKSWVLAASAAALVLVGVLVSHLTENRISKTAPPASTRQAKSWAIDSAETSAVSLNYL